MDLIDFKKNDQLNALREGMGTHKFGYYELFDPDFHLKAEELEEIDHKHLVAPFDELHECVDHTIRYKNARVLYVTHHQADDSSNFIQLTLHFAKCEHFDLQSGDAFITTKDLDWDDFKLRTYLQCIYRDLKNIKVTSVTVCSKCMQRLRYNGYDEMKSRKEIYNKELIMGFNIDQFYENYPKYPVKLGETRD